MTEWGEFPGEPISEQADGTGGLKHRPSCKRFGDVLERFRVTLCNAGRGRAEMEQRGRAQARARARARAARIQGGPLCVGGPLCGSKVGASGTKTLSRIRIPQCSPVFGNLIRCLGLRVLACACSYHSLTHCFRCRNYSNMRQTPF